MKYIFITFSGLGLPIAYKLQQNGYEVHVGIIDNIKDYVIEEEMRSAKESEVNRSRRLQLFKNMLDIKPAHEIISWMQTLKRPREYFVFFDENNLYRWADKIRHLRFHGTFPTKEDYLFETDREMAKQFVKEHYPKLYVPDVMEFEKAKDAISFLKENNEMWVLKGRIDSAKTFVPAVDDPKLANIQIIEMLRNFPDKYERMGFILERHIPSIIELTPEKMYYDGVPIATSVMFENKEFGSGNISIQTGCSEDLVFPTAMGDRINRIAFPPIVDELAKKA